MRRSHLLVLIVFSAAALGQDLKPRELPKPRTEGGMPLMQALKERKSTRSFSGKELPAQVLSDLLWAAFGVNRPESGLRTAPSTRNWQGTDIYVATAGGLYLYNAKDHKLEPVLAEDIREATGTQAFVRDAPVNLVFVADFSRMGDGPEAAKVLDAAADTGFISQNVYLFCASEGLATVVRGSVDKAALSRRMGLRPEQRVVLAQSVGYP